MARAGGNYCHILGNTINVMASLAYRNAFLQKISAQVSAYLLWYLGFKVESQENYILVNDGLVEVNTSCTAFFIFIIFVSLIFILKLYFPRLIQNLPLTTAIALGIGFRFVHRPDYDYGTGGQR